MIRHNDPDCFHCQLMNFVNKFIDDKGEPTDAVICLAMTLGEVVSNFENDRDQIMTDSSQAAYMHMCNEVAIRELIQRAEKSQKKAARLN